MLDLPGAPSNWGRRAARDAEERKAPAPAGSAIPTRVTGTGKMMIPEQQISKTLPGPGVR